MRDQNVPARAGDERWFEYAARSNGGGTNEIRSDPYRADRRGAAAPGERGRADCWLRTPRQAPGQTFHRLAVVTPGARTNQGWDQQAADAVDAVAAEAGIEAVVAENGGYDDITPILRDLAGRRRQPDHLPRQRLPDRLPRVRRRVERAGGGDREPGCRQRPASSPTSRPRRRKSPISPASWPVKTTKTGTVGVVVSGEPPTWNYMTVGFAEGLKATKADAKLLYSVIGEAAYDDAAGAKRVTEQQIAAGADVIFGMGDGASFGMLQAIEEHNAAGRRRQGLVHRRHRRQERRAWRCRCSARSSSTTPASTSDMVDDLKNGTFGKVYTMDVKNGGVRLLDLPEDVGSRRQGRGRGRPRTVIVDGSLNGFGHQRRRRDEGQAGGALPAVVHRAREAHVSHSPSPGSTGEGARG